MRQNNIRAISFILFLAIFCGFSSSAPEQSSTSYFLVAIPSMYPLGLSDSYILPLSDPLDVQYARNLIAAGGFKIISAVITVGTDGINRDMLASDSTEWSWHVTEFLGFADAAPEICDGNPTFTEGEAQIANDGEQWQICYWTYTVVAELPQSVPNKPSTWGRIKSLY